MTSKDKGNIALGRAIQYFTNLGYKVLIPLTDSQDYDLAFDDGIKINTVQVKYTSQKYASGSYHFKLVVSGHQNAQGESYEKIPEYNRIDYYFISTELEDDYFIPTKEICHQKSCTLSGEIIKYKIN